MQNSELFAYVAGLIDGEGCFSIQKANRTFRTTIQVSMTNRDVTTWLHEQFGGHLGHTPATGNCEELYLWVLASKPELAKLIPQLLTYLRVKRLPALIILEFCQKFNVGKGGTYTAEQYAEMELYHKVMMLANSKGPGSNDIKLRLVQANS